MIGWLKNQTHSLSSGLFLVAAIIAVAGMAVIILIPAKLVNRQQSGNGGTHAVSVQSLPRVFRCIDSGSVARNAWPSFEFKLSAQSGRIAVNCVLTHPFR